MATVRQSIGGGEQGPQGWKVATIGLMGPLCVGRTIKKKKRKPEDDQARRTSNAIGRQWAWQETLVAKGKKLLSLGKIQAAILIVRP